MAPLSGLRWKSLTAPILRAPGLLIFGFCSTGFKVIDFQYSSLLLASKNRLYLNICSYSSRLSLSSSAEGRAISFGVSHWASGDVTAGSDILQVTPRQARSGQPHVQCSAEVCTERGVSPPGEAPHAMCQGRVCNTLYFNCLFNYQPPTGGSWVLYLPFQDRIGDLRDVHNAELGVSDNR